MVQMKACIFSIITIITNLYIPHGSDERGIREGEENIISRLYIPHGSDERKTPMIFLHKLHYFISHMVQMKEILLSRTATQASALYPTWFR